MASYWGSPLVQFSKFKNLPWVCWFLCKNLSNLVSLPWKFHSPYCHTEYLSYVKSIETHERAFLPLNISAVGSVINVVLAAPYPPYYTELFWTKIFCNTNCFCMVFSFIYYILLYWLKFQYYFSSFNIKRTLISNIFSTLKIAGKILEML